MDNLVMASETAANVTEKGGFFASALSKVSDVAGSASSYVAENPVKTGVAVAAVAATAIGLYVWKRKASKKADTSSKEEVVVNKTASGEVVDAEFAEIDPQATENLEPETPDSGKKGSKK